MEDIKRLHSVIKQDSKFQKAIAFTRSFYGYQYWTDNVKDTLEEVKQYEDWQIALAQGHPSEIEERDFGVDVTTATDDRPLSTRVEVSDVDSSVDEDSPRIRLLERYCSLGIVPKISIQLLLGHNCWLRADMGFADLSIFSIGDALVGKNDASTNWVLWWMTGR